MIEAHAKLKEITIVKERTRIAQEMHDSIGHSLIALRMHLEFAENMIEANPQKAGEAIVKAHDFSQKSIKELRKAVAVLKDQSVNSQIDLEELLNDMIESLQTSGKLKFTLNFDKEVESGNQDMKNCIYNSVREAVTNGLKHGKAQQFLINITKSSEKIRVIVEDDGEGCSQIKKSHGLQGIEERIGLLNGKVSFSSEKGRGFKLLAEIPVMYKTNAIKTGVM
ncbi:sensor histidine kinase [Ectobacillus funiculus]|uniref:sensor histidine kinase n=1 Tax=Ectobacillus funiculus TaxID=137993 RepID=UPI00101D141F|nr:sensor histidine kinase [Ectobacillus funiculus]